MKRLAAPGVDDGCVRSVISGRVEPNEVQKQYVFARR